MTDLLLSKTAIGIKLNHILELLSFQPLFAPSSSANSEDVLSLKIRHKSQPVETIVLHLENEKMSMRERDEDRGSRVSQLQVVSRCGGSGDKPLWRCSGLPSLHFSSHCSTSCLSDRSHLAWQRAETQHSPTRPSVAPACHSAESTGK